MSKEVTLVSASSGSPSPRARSLSLIKMVHECFILIRLEITRSPLNFMHNLLMIESYKLLYFGQQRPNRLGMVSVVDIAVNLTGTQYQSMVRETIVVRTADD